MTRARRTILGSLFSAGLAAAAAAPLAFADEKPHALPAPTQDEPALRGPQTIVLAGGCFWGVQGVFQHVKGVTRAVSGYAGGAAATARYEMTSEGTTGHAESVEVSFDPAQISLGGILQIYFAVAHDPTELNRQGPDHGTQYRSAIFPRDDEQAKIARAYIAQLDQAHAFNAPVVTKIEPGKTFYPAEAYHQDFLALNPDYPYIVVNDLPKIDALKRLYPDEYRADPVLVGAVAR
ncbi:peptide-methionine (S)-S-oxide reductase MsrA [Rhodoblastus sp.]|jgi:peptide-methionine (S)-S-oxide reductase|uniref:peptide-methionine (S)-S-oxide reductase MsrA n=1 Tax=Rhodoblastus sp. TaxID=1962975 RepID=UPI00261B647C|nr:peptide-methionine (S)-S-oxide reductase MsrA [Rhodoblastus sp.]